MAAPTGQTSFDPKYDQYDFPTIAPVPLPGHPGHTTPEQDAKVFQLRSELERLGYTERLDTLTLLRFLRARKFDVQAAKTMWVSSATCSFFFGFLFVYFVCLPARTCISIVSMTDIPLSIGSLKVRSGGKSSEQTTSLALSITLRRLKSSNSTPSTTIKPTK